MELKKENKVKKNNNKKEKIISNLKENKKENYFITFLEKEIDINNFIYSILLKIKGIGPRIANFILRKYNISRTFKMKDLSQKEISELEINILEISKYLPNWMNSTNNGIKYNLELIESVKKNIEEEKQINSYIGRRHSFGLKVRGQNLKSNGRSNRVVGVIFKKDVSNKKKTNK